MELVSCCHVSEARVSLFLKDAFDEVVKFFGETSKTMPPSLFFPVFVRFVKAYRVSKTTRKIRVWAPSLAICVGRLKAYRPCGLQQAEGENQQRKRQEQMLMERLLEQEAMMNQENQKVGSCSALPPRGAGGPHVAISRGSSCQPWLTTPNNRSRCTCIIHPSIHPSISCLSNTESLEAEAMRQGA